MPVEVHRQRGDAAARLTGGRGRRGSLTPIDLEDYQRAAELRAALRRFLRRSEEIAARNGLTPQRQLLLLMIKGAADGSESATIGDLAERMQLAQNTVTDLVGRAEASGLVVRGHDASDGRIVRLRLTAEGERRLAATVSGLREDRAALAALARSLATGAPAEAAPPDRPS